MTTPTIKVATIHIAPGTPLRTPTGHMQDNPDGSHTLTHRSVSKVTQQIIEDGILTTQRSRRRWIVTCGVLTLASAGVIAWLATSLSSCNQSKT